MHQKYIFYIKFNTEVSYFGSQNMVIIKLKSNSLWNVTKTEFSKASFLVYLLCNSTKIAIKNCKNFTKQ